MVPEPGAGKNFPQGPGSSVWPHIPPSPTLAAYLMLSVYQETSPEAEPTLREPLSLKKILKASANVCKEPQEEGRAVARIVPSHWASDVLIDKGLNVLEPPREGLRSCWTGGRGKMTQTQTGK